MEYLTWDSISRGDVIYDTVNKESVRIDSKFYNVYAERMFTGVSKTCSHIIRHFEENRYTKVNADE